jgi:hypothetical protein
MKKFPVVAKSYPIASKPHAVEATKGRILEARDDALQPVGLFGQPFLSFRYSYTEITANGRTARVKSHRARYENGRLESERFEGELDRVDYERKLSEAQRHFAEQATAMLGSVFSFFPLVGKLDSESD